jgi:hypothetical protein
MRSQVFRIERGIDQHWHVSHHGSKVHSFLTRLEAEEFAKRWAKVNHPSVVRVEVNGQIEREWKFGVETPGIKWQSRQ